MGAFPRTGTAEGYAGDVTPAEAWEILATDPRAMLVDVRTQAEWTFVGVPDLGDLDKQPRFVAWQEYPDMVRNAGFAEALADIGKDTTILFLCRSGARSKAAATALTALGYTDCRNVLEGFEGNLDGDHHRGRTEGWKAAGLPWEQS